MYGYMPRFELIDNTSGIAVMRSRVRVKVSDFISDNTSDDDGKKRHKKARSARAAILLAVMIPLSVAALLYLRRMRSKHGGNSKTLSISIKAVEEVASPTKDWSHCKDEPPKIEDKIDHIDKRIEPMWLPAYPTSLPGSYSNFLDALTAVPKAAKNYYRVSKGLKRCHDRAGKEMIDAVTCEIVHRKSL